MSHWSVIIKVIHTQKWKKFINNCRFYKSAKFVNFPVAKWVISKFNSIQAEFLKKLHSQTIFSEPNGNRYIIAIMINFVEHIKLNIIPFFNLTLLHFENFHPLVNGQIDQLCTLVKSTILNGFHSYLSMYNINYCSSRWHTNFFDSCLISTKYGEVSKCLEHVVSNTWLINEKHLG